MLITRQLQQSRLVPLALGRGLATEIPAPHGHQAGRGGMKPPLRGLKVLDFTSALSGPSTTQYLGDLGATVWKLEVPGKGDDTRSWGPPFLKHTAHAPVAPHTEWFDFESSYFASTNRNKQSITIDLKKAEGRAIALRLAAKADIIVENLLTGKLAKFGLGYQDIVAVNPKVIYCSITGYGQNGPYSTAPGYDAIVAGEAGIIHCTGEPGRLPVRPQVALADHTAGFYAYGAILAGLLGRKRSGTGRFIDISMFDCQVAGLSVAASEWLNLGVDAQARGTASSFIAPDQIFHTSDGSVALAASTDVEFESLSNALGLPELTRQDRYSTNQHRLRNRDTLDAIITAKISSMTTRQADSALFSKGFAFGVVNNLERTYAHPQVAAREITSNVPHRFIGTVRLANPPVIYNSERMKTRFAPPALGEHTRDVLRAELAASEQELTGLEANGITHRSKTGP